MTQRSQSSFLDLVSAQVRPRDAASKDYLINPMNIYQLLCGILFSTKHRTMKKTHKTKIPAFIDMTPYSGDITEIYTECVNKGDHF